MGTPPLVAIQVRKQTVSGRCCVFTKFPDALGPKNFNRSLFDIKTKYQFFAHCKSTRSNSRLETQNLCVLIMNVLYELFILSFSICPSLLQKI